MQQGIVKFFNEAKGFGFITNENGGKDIFVHTSALIDFIQENDHVSFDVENSDRGLNAVRVRKA